MIIPTTDPFYLPPGFSPKQQATCELLAAPKPAGAAATQACLSQQPSGAGHRQAGAAAWHDLTGCPAVCPKHDRSRHKEDSREVRKQEGILCNTTTTARITCNTLNTEVASTGPTNKLSVGMGRHQLAHSQPTAPMSPVGISWTPYIGWRYVLATTLLNPMPLDTVKVLASDT